jgi:hypothetical protein
VTTRIPQLKTISFRRRLDHPVLSDFLIEVTGGEVLSLRREIERRSKGQNLGRAISSTLCRYGRSRSLHYRAEKDSETVGRKRIVRVTLTAVLFFKFTH